MKLIFSVICIAFFGCASKYQIQRHHNTFLRRMPQINKIESGRVIGKGSFVAAANASYSLKEPKVMIVSDSSFKSRSSIFGDEFTIITSSKGYLYESRVMISGEAAYGFTDELSAGISLDASLGRIADAPLFNKMTIVNNDIEGSLSLKFAKKFKKLGVCIKPELVLTHLYGERLWSENDYDSSIATATEKMSHYTLSVRSSSVIRYEIIEKVSPFIGFQIKTQQFPLADDDFDHEVCFGLYAGFDFLLNCISINPFIAVPFGTSTTGFKSPLSAGTKVDFILKAL